MQLHFVNGGMFVLFSPLVLNIVIGVLLDAMQLPTWVVYIVVVYAVYQVLIELYLELMDCLSKKESECRKV